MQQDGSVIELVRSQVSSRLLSEFEVRFANRRRQKQTPSQTRTVQVRMRLRKRLSFKRRGLKRRVVTPHQSSAKSVAQVSQSVTQPAKSATHRPRRVNQNYRSQASASRSAVQVTGGTASVKLNHTLNSDTSHFLIPASPGSHVHVECETNVPLCRHVNESSGST